MEGSSTEQRGKLRHKEGTQCLLRDIRYSQGLGLGQDSKPNPSAQWLYPKHQGRGAALYSQTTWGHST